MQIQQLNWIKYVTILFLILNVSLQSQFDLDKVQYKQVGPRMFFTKYVVHSVPWSIDVFEADMMNQYFAIETVKAFDVLAGGREKTSSMSARRNFTEHWSVSAINGDFFDMKTGMPNNIQVENGEILRIERTDWPTIGFNSNNEVSISKPHFSGMLLLRDSSLMFNGVNTAREDNKLIIYNQFYGTSTGTSNHGFEASVNPISTWFANDTIYYLVDSINDAGENTTIPAGSAVISASGTIANYLNTHISVCDTIKIILSIRPSVNKLKEMIGGHPIIVEDGYSTSMNPNNSFVYTRHPRTAVGINKDTTKLFLVTVDGRQASSLGMNLYELADLMLQLGVYHGINLDGGGSTTMVIRNEVVNTPSDVSGERPVSNALLVVSKAPLDTLSSIDISPALTEIFSGDQIQFNAFGVDNYFNPIIINPALLNYALSDATLGTISSSGLFTANLKSGKCNVTVSYGTITDSAEVKIKMANGLRLTPPNIVTD
jgi:exopolysaccharide biosynthesis protein